MYIGRPQGNRVPEHKNVSSHVILQNKIYHNMKAKIPKEFILKSAPIMQRNHNINTVTPSGIFFFNKQGTNMGTNGRQLIQGRKR